MNENNKSLGGQRYAFIETQDITLAAALLTMGVCVIEDCPFIKTQVGVDQFQYRFFFKDVSNCGSYSTLKLIDNWKDDDFHIEEPEHPFSYIKCAFKNRNGLLDVVKQSKEMITKQVNGKWVTVSKNASEETRKQIIDLI